VKHMVQEITGEYWNEVIVIKAASCACVIFCLEPNESVHLSLTATDRVDVALSDWEAYRDWERHGFEGMPDTCIFANNTESVSWRDRENGPPYVKVLIVSNPGEEDTRAAVSATTIPRSQPGKLGGAGK
jgi:hypothetical protein